MDKKLRRGDGKQPSKTIQQNGERKYNTNTMESNNNSKIHKKGPKEDLANQRGIFLTYILSKVYEKVKLLQNVENICNMSRMQCAGRKNRSPLEHVITLNAIIEKQRSEKKPTYILSAVAEK